MKTKEIFSDLLHLGEAWQIRDVKYSDDLQSVEIHIDYTAAQGYCTETGELCELYDFRAERKWQHLPMWQLKTFIISRIPRVKNSFGKVVSVEVPWAEESKRYSFFFEKYVIDMLKATHNQTKTAQMANTSFDVVNRIMHGSVARGLARRSFAPGELRLLGIDEKSHNRGHNYVIILVDLKNSRVLDVAQGRTKDATQKLITDTLTSAQRADIKAISMDMWEAFITVAGELLPSADIVHDKFHIVQYLKDAVDKVRRKEVKTEPILINGKYTVLKNQENLTEKQQVQFDQIMDANLKTAQAWAYAETFKTVYESRTMSEAYAHFDMWLDKVRSSTLTAMKKVADMLENHTKGIVNYVKHKITNAKTERLNGKIQNLKNVGRGYRSFENFRSAILFFNGNLALYSHKFL